MKWCNRGQHFVDLAGFSKSSKSKDGLQAKCRQCAKQYEAANVEAIRERRKAYRDSNKSAIALANKLRYESDKESFALRHRLYRETHKAEIQEQQRAAYLQNRSERIAYSHNRYHGNKSEILAKQKERYDANKEPFLESNRKYRIKNREQILKAKQLAWQQYYANPANREYHLQRNVEYAQKHPEKLKVQRARRRSLKSNALGVCTPDQWADKLRYFGFRCYLCSRTGNANSLHIEHRIPLVRGGTNWPSNLAPACGTCNLQKGTKTENEYREFLNILAANKR